MQLRLTYRAVVSSGSHSREDAALDRDSTAKRMSWEKSIACKGKHRTGLDRLETGKNV